MASLAMSLQVQGSVIADARVVFGGIAGKAAARDGGRGLAQGQDARRRTGRRHSVPRALANAAPLKYNAMKIEMAGACSRRASRS